MPVPTRPINTRRRTNSPKFNHVRGHGCRNDSLAKLAGKLEFEPDFPKFVVRPPKSSREFVVLRRILLTFPLGRLKLSSRFLSYPLFEHRVSAMSRQNVSELTEGAGEEREERTMRSSSFHINLSTPNFVSRGCFATNTTWVELEVSQ